MGIERRLRHPTWKDYAKGTMITIVGAGIILFGASEYKTSKRNTDPIMQESLYDGMRRNRENRKSISETLFPNNKSLHSTYKNTSMPPREVVDAVDNAGRLLDENMPMILMIGGVLTAVYGASHLTNLTYRRR